MNSIFEELFNIYKQEISDLEIGHTFSNRLCEMYKLMHILNYLQNGDPGESEYAKILNKYER